MAEDQVIEQQPPSKTKALYDAVSKDYNVGTYAEFDNKLKDPEKRKAFYNGVGKEYNLGSYDEFEQKINGSAVKKKDGTPSADSPSGISPAQTKTDQRVNTSDSDLPKGKKIQSNYKNNSLTPGDIHAVTNGPSDAKDWNGLTAGAIAGSINNKGDNLKKATEASGQITLTNALNKQKEIRDELDNIRNNPRAAGILYGDNLDKQVEILKGQESSIRSGIQRSYDAKKKQIVPELLDNLRGDFTSDKWTNIFDNPDGNLSKSESEQAFEKTMGKDAIVRKSPIQWDAESHKLTPKSVEWVAGKVDSCMNKKGDPTVNAQVSGDLDNKKRTYEDLTRSVVDYLNTVPAQREQEKFTQEFSDKHPKIKEAFTANQQVNEYFSREHVDAVKAAVNTNRDKEFIKTGQKYYNAETGIFTTNQDYAAISHKYAQLVHDGKMSDEVARKQIDAEVKQHPALKKIKDNLDDEVKKINEHTQTQYQKYLIDGLRKDRPNLTVYADGTTGLSGMTEEQYKKMIGDYEAGMENAAKKIGGEQVAATLRQSNEKAKRVGAFWGSLGAATNDMTSAFSKMMFNKTQWGGDNVRHYEAQEIASPSISQSDVAAAWNWKGLESLKDPNFWLSKVGSMVPIIAGTAAVGAATEGEGIPQYVSWLASAGLFTAQGGLTTYNQLLNTRDAQGNLLTEADASHFMAEDMEKSILPNVLMMAATSGTLLKAKNISKPTILGAAAKGIAGAAAAQPFFTWQGYESYANMLEAQGKKADFWDYMQSKDFKDNLINGMVVGGGLSLLHAPGAYMKSLDNWTKMVHSSEGEFKNLIPQNYAIQQEMSGNGNYLRDALKLHVFNTDPEGLNEQGKRQLVDLKNSLLYSVNLDKNIKIGNLDRTNINDLYQAHNLALADQYDYLSDQSKDNKSISSLYSDKAKEFREQAKAASDESAKYHYLLNEEGLPIFMSDKSYSVLEKEGTIEKWMKDKTIKGVVYSDDPEFSQRYKDHIEAKNEATVEGKSLQEHAADMIEENKDKLGTTYAVAKENTSLFYKEISDQIHGVNSDGSPSLRPDAEQAVREQYGDDIVDVAKVMYPVEEKPSAESVEEKKPEPKEEYKPNIRDDYFAQKDFFTPEEKEKYSKLNEDGKDKMIDDKRDELKAQAEEDKITVSEMIDKPGIYKGKKGTFSQDGQAVIFKVDGTNREYELGNVNEIGSQSLKDFGIEQESSVVGANEENNITVRGKEYVNRYSDPLAAINYDEDGNVVSVNLETPDGKKRAFRGNIGEDLEIHLKEISKNNEQPALEEFINSDEPTRKEINDAGLAEAAEEKPTGDTEKVQRKAIKPKVEISSPKNKQDVKSEKTEAEGRKGDVLIPEEGAEKSEGSAPPLPPVPEPRTVSETPKEEFTAVRKEKNKEIAGAKELFDKQKIIKWSDTYDNALSNVQAMHPEKNLYEAMKARINEFVTKLDNKVLFNPTSEDNAVFNVFKQETNRKIAQIEGWDSPDDMQRMTALAEYDVLQKDLYSVARVTNPGGEAGRAFNILQSEIAGDPDAGLKIRRMELLGSKGGGKLSEADLAFTASQWDREKAIMERQQELREKGMQEKFDKQLAKMKADYEKQLKEGKAPVTKKDKQDRLLSQKGKDLADKIRSGKLKGTYATFPGLPQAINVVLEGIAKLVEGGFTLAQAIDGYVKDNKIKNKEQFQKDLFEVLNKQERQEDAYAKIEAIAKSGATDIANDMVAKNLIRDYINSHVGLHDNKDVLDIAHAELKKILPDIEKSKLREAYLKEGDYKQPTKKQLESGFKVSEKTFNKLSRLEKDITDLNDKKNLFKRTNNKSQTPFDKEIEAKEKEKKDIMTSMDIKSSSEDKYTKASYDQRAISHNDRLDELGKSIQEKLDKGGLSTSSEKQLRKLKGQLDASKIKLDDNSAISQSKTLDGGLAILKAIKSEFTRAAMDDVTKLGEINRNLQRVIDKFDSDKNDTQQEIKLQRAKDKAKRDMQEFGRKLVNNEFEDNPIVELTKSDAELIKLERDRSILQQVYLDKKREYERANQSGRKRTGEFLRAAEVSYLIGGPMTIVKVGSSAVLRPQMEALTKMTFGKGYEALPFDTTKSIAARAKLGGESQSTRAIKKGYEAYFRQYSPEQLQKLYTDANDKYEQSSKEYHEFKGQVQQIDQSKDPKEYESAQKKLAELKNKKDNDLLAAVGNTMYHFISGSSLKEAWEVLLHRSAEIERQFGDFSREGWESMKSKTGKEKASIALDNLSYVMNFTGRSHAALKNFSARQSFAAGFMARLEGSLRDGIDISSPEKQLEIAHESYLDWDRGKYQESNWVSDTWNKWTTATEKVSPELAFLMKADIAITRVPVNMLREGIMEYSLGAIRASVMTAREYYKAKGVVLQDGYTPENEAQFRTELREQLNKIDPNKAATILRAFRKGGFGMGMYALALTGYAAFGGFAHKGQANEDKKKALREQDTGVPEIKSSEIQLGDYKLPMWASKVIEHTPAFQPMLFATGLAQVYENNIIDGKTTPEAAAASVYAHVEHIVNSIPQAEVIGAIGAGILQKVKPSGQWDDVDQDGNPMKRKAFHMSDYARYLGFGDKSDILSEAYYKQAVSAQQKYRQAITEVETNLSIPKKEKEEQREALLKELNETIDSIYKENKESPQ